MKKPKPEKSDQENAQRAFALLCKMTLEHPDIRPNIWISSSWDFMVGAYTASEVSYKEFCEDIERVKEHYKNRWDK